MVSAENAVNSFPIYDTSKSVGTYTANLQRQAAQRQAEQKALQDDLGKIKIDGLRDADKEDYFKGFEDWRTTAQQAAKERDFRKKAELQSASDRKYLELQSLVNKSKEYNKIHQDVSGRFLDDKFRDQFTDDAVDKWRRSGTLPLSSKDIVLDPTALERQMDLSGVNKVLTDVDEDLLKQAKYSNPVTRRINTGKGADSKQGTEYIYNRTVDPQTQLDNYTQLYNTKRDIRNYVRQEFPEQFATMPEDQARDFALAQIVSKRPIQRQDAPKLEWDRAPDRFYNHWDYQLDNPKQNTFNGSVPQNISIPFSSGKGFVPAQGYVGITTPAKKNFVGTQGAIAMETGKPLPALNSSDEYSIVGAGNFPVMKVDGNFGGKKIVKGSLAQADFAKENPNAVTAMPFIHVKVPAKGKYDAPEDILVPYTNAPANIMNSKPIAEALANFKPANGKPKPQTTNVAPSNSVFSKAEENGINAVMKKSGASREQVIQALKKAGKIK